MPINLLQHFWLFFVAMMLVNVVIWRSRLAQLVTIGQASQAEVTNFLRGAAIAFVVYGLAAEVIVVAVGWPNVLCFYSVAWSSSGALSMLALTGGAYVLLLWWVWASTGADTLARLGPVLWSRSRTTSYSPVLIRVFVTALLVVISASVAFNFVSPQTIPDCVAPTAANPL